MPAPFSELPEPSLDVVDKDTQQIVHLRASLVANAWKTGRIDLIVGQRYPVQLKDGRYGTIPAEDMADALKVPGTRIVSAEEVQAEATLKKTLGENQDRKAELWLVGILLLVPFSLMLAWRLIWWLYRATISEARRPFE